MKILLKLEDDEFPFTYIDHDRYVARAILINDKHEVALNKLHGKDNFGSRNYYETPGGGINENEDPSSAVLREVEEETGYRSSIIEEIGIVDDYYNLIHRHNINYYYLLKVETFVGKHQEEYEKSMIEKLVWLDIDEAIKTMRNMDVSPVARLVIKRELPVLLKAKEMIEKL
ncbi:MAG: NUDIX domain-containing protein [Bacilli bacterium]|nr:NUDIX domain-containing protein [Bacilli bacterium]